jgi:hypothetical protein
MAERPTRGAPATRVAGQASVELLAGVPGLLLAGLIALQLLAAGYTLTLADGAVEAGALALAAGEPAKPAILDALPGWADRRVEVDIDGGRVAVRLRPPSPVPGIADRLASESDAWVRRAKG